MTIFTPKLLLVGSINPVASVETIEMEPMLHGASIAFALEKGGPLTTSILEQITCLAKPNKHYVIDTKSVMLMPGMFPAIPGWHCDGVVRQHQFAQPDVLKMNSDVLHYTAIVSSHHEGVSNTEFMEETLDIPVDNQRVWGSISEWIELRPCRTRHIQDGEILEFSQSSLHRAEKAYNRGWRYFFRMSEYHMPPLNKIRHQVQVYTDVSAGW